MRTPRHYVPSTGYQNGWHYLFWISLNQIFLQRLIYYIVSKNMCEFNWMQSKKNTWTNTCSKFVHFKLNYILLMDYIISPSIRPCRHIIEKDNSISGSWWCVLLYGILPSATPLFVGCGLSSMNECRVANKNLFKPEDIIPF